jgi:hypothetical protein
MQWQHPATPLPPALMAAQGGGASAAAAIAAAAAAGLVLPEQRAGSGSSAAAAILQGRVQAWRDALRAAYVAVRHGHCPVLYVCGQVFRQSFTAVICAPGVAGRGSGGGRITAVVSRTNRMLRSHLASFGAEGVLAGHAEQQASGAAAPQQDQRQLVSGWRCCAAGCAPVPVTPRCCLGTAAAD